MWHLLAHTWPVIYIESWKCVLYGNVFVICFIHLMLSFPGRKGSAFCSSDAKYDWRSLERRIGSPRCIPFQPAGTGNTGLDRSHRDLHPSNLSWNQVGKLHFAVIVKLVSSVCVMWWEEPVINHHWWQVLFGRLSFCYCHRFIEMIYAVFFRQGYRLSLHATVHFNLTQEDLIQSVSASVLTR